MDNFNSAFDASISTASSIDPVLSKPVFVLNSRFEVVWYNSVIRDLVATGVGQSVPNAGIRRSYQRVVFRYIVSRPSFVTGASCL